jgi:hypothetical protein
MKMYLAQTWREHVKWVDLQLRDNLNLVVILPEIFNAFVMWYVCSPKNVGLHMCKFIVIIQTSIYVQVM